MRRRLILARGWLDRCAKRLRRDERGNVVMYVTLVTATLLGLTGLALDGSRAMITHSEAQSAADAAALAGASQLDGQSGACARAKTTASAVANQQRFAGSGASTVGIASGSPVCLSSLPGSDSTAISGGLVTTDDAASRYVQVTTQSLTHRNTLLSSVSSAPVTIQRSAVAGFRRSLCAGAPVMMACNTLSWTPGKVFDAWDNKNGSLKGWLSDCGNSANCVHDTLASLPPPFCVVDDSMEAVPGNKTQKAADGINTRFGDKSSAAEPSDLDIMDFTKYSKDFNGGSGWDCQKYWDDNHKSDSLAKPAGCSNGTTSVTRYSVYQAERAANKIPKDGRPSDKTPTTSGERRLVYLAVFSCTGGSVPDYFIKAFLVAPSTGNSEKTAYVEPIGVATSKSDPTAVHEEVQLYR